MIVGGVLEPIKAYFGTVENQGRGSLHLHLLIWFDHDMKPADMKEKIQNASFREKLKVYLEDIINEDLDQFKDNCAFQNLDVARTWNTLPRLTRNNIYAAISTIDLSGLKQNIYESGTRSVPMKQLSSSSIFHVSPSPNKFLQAPTHDRSASGVLDDDVYDGDENNNKENFQIQSAEHNKKYRTR
ncbi:unnamed protein product [Rotaria sp. Silwood1]|nr:unnamed protein product [Rotaria sp. Silwood1]CAF4799381.1 unnamed protein product [Rotaria sp. Silwood1]